MGWKGIYDLLIEAGFNRFFFRTVDEAYGFYISFIVNYLIPLNLTTNLSYDKNENLFVSITIYNILGNAVDHLFSINRSLGVQSI